MPRKKDNKSTPIDSVKHQDKRANIPTEELRDFMADDEKKPQKVLYPRDPSLDPQLVWKGKDEQDSQDLEVSTVPIYIQEKIHSHAIIDDFRTQIKKEQPPQQSQQLELELFSDFNGLEFDQLIDFYQHQDGVKWANRMILGDSLLVMNSLAEKEGLKGKVQMIYLDPPYGIKFSSNWQVSTHNKVVKDGSIKEVTRQPEQVKAFRDTWQLGIHSYLPYLRDRLVVARELLTETGSVFVQIGDENVHLVRCLMDEVFGRDNFCLEIILAKASAQSSTLLPGVNDFLLWYAKDVKQVKYRKLFAEREPFENPTERYVCVETEEGEVIDLTIAQKTGKQSLPKGRICQLWPTFSQTGGSSSIFKYTLRGVDYTPPAQYGWQTTLKGFSRLDISGRLHPIGKSLRWKVYYDQFPYKILNSVWLDLRPGGFGEKRVYVVQTDDRVISRCLLMTTDPGDLVLDPTCGSGTTPYVAEQWGRRWITIDTSRVALALARTRLMSAKYHYYLLADSLEGIQKEAEITKQLPPKQPKVENDIKKGFIYQRAPHVTLKAIANNQEIDTIHAKWQSQLEPIRTQLNQLLKKSWEEWEIPREPETKWSDEAKNLLTQWWSLRPQRQKEIDECIARNADTELLYDKPYEDKKRIRVTGPFTVESLSPHRILSTDEERPASENEGIAQASDQFENRIIDNLNKAGVQNTFKNERLKVKLEPYAGTYIHAVGEYTEGDETVKQVAIHIGPEYGTVSVDDIKEAAKEAVKGLGHNVLIVCGFAFEPNVNEESKRYGKLQLLITRMNADLLLGDEVLKKTGAGNLFMVFGEPDIELEHENGQLVVTLKGLDIYDPTTGEIRSSSPDDIACWFIDTDYNEESFFVRHAYFTGANQPYDKLKRALKAEIDEDAWSQIYSTSSRPFNPPKGKNGKPGKIAVKVINHYGDEVLKVYEC
jgi:adenine-specific DNA-methyltransferase